MKRKQLHLLQDGVAASVKAFVEKTVQPLHAQIKALEAQQVKALVKVADVHERTVTLCFKDGTPLEGGVIHFDGMLLDRGVYVQLKAYEKGDVVSHGGHMWICQEPTSAVPGRPGEAARAWRLSVKAGRDARDVRSAIAS